MHNEDFVRIDELWSDLVNNLRYKYRFFLESKLLDDIGHIVQKHVVDVESHSVFYRARIFKPGGNHQGKEPFWGYDAENSFINKNPDSIEDGRANPYAIAYLYVAETVDTACAEVRPYLDDYISVAEIQNAEPLKIIDLTGINLGVTFDYGISATEEEYLSFLIVSSFSQPVKNRGSNYLITQYISEYIKKLGFDGIKFKSSLNKNGVNLTIFNYEKCKAVGSSLYQFTDMTVKFSKVQPVQKADENGKQYINVVDRDGKDRRAEVIGVFTLQDYNNKYIMYCFPDEYPDDIYAQIQNAACITSKMATVYVSTLNKLEDQFEFCGVPENEMEAVLEVMKEMIDLGDTEGDEITETPNEVAENEGLNKYLDKDPQSDEKDLTVEEKNIFNVLDEQGNEVRCEIMFTFDSDETGKHYIIYTDNSTDDEGNAKIYASTFDPESDKTALGAIESEREWMIIEKILESLTDPDTV
jgi:uncharacterized protein YrzB (UPF0473 family)